MIVVYFTIGDAMENRTTDLNGHTFYYVDGPGRSIFKYGYWVSLMGDSCGCNQELIGIPADIHGNIGTWGERRNVENGDAQFMKAVVATPLFSSS